MHTLAAVIEAPAQRAESALGVILLPVGAGECSLSVTAVQSGMDPGWPAGRDAAGSSLRSPRPGRHLVVPGYLPAECAPVLFAGLGFGAEECLDEGRQVSGLGDQVKVAAVVDGQLASRDQAVQDPRV
jgi:hypothetical protein